MRADGARSRVLSSVAAVLGHRAVLPALVLLALLAINALLTPGFATLEVRDGRLFGAIVDVARNGSLVVLVATGMTLVIATGGIDLSVGSLMALAGVVAALLIVEHDRSVPTAVAGGLGAALLVGLFNGALVAWVRLQPIVATLITLVAGRGLAQTLSGDQKVRFDAPAFEFLGSGSLAGLPVPVFIAAGAAIATLAVLRFTVLGLAVEATGGNARAARLCGVRVGAVRLFVYAASGVLAGVAGLIAAADIREADVASGGLYMELDAILAVVIGGTSLAGGRPNVLGSVLGALIMQTLTVTLQMRGVPTEHTLVIKAAAVVGVVWVQSPAFARMLSPGTSGRRAGP